MADLGEGPRGATPLPPLFWVKRKNQRWKKNQQGKQNNPPPPPPLAQVLDPPLNHNMLWLVPFMCLKPGDLSGGNED